MASNFANLSMCRFFSNSVALNGKRNFRKFNVYDSRLGNYHRYQIYKMGLYPDVKEYIDRGERPVLKRTVNGKAVNIPETIPELIVPDLEGFQLKPYVSYRVTEINQKEFTPQDLFYSVYSKKIAQDFECKKLNEDGSSMEPSPEEKLTAEEARILDKKTGSDIFGGEKLPPLDTSYLNTKKKLIN